MHRIVKLLWIIFILWMVSFIICDEKWIKIELDGNHLVFNNIEKIQNYGSGVDEQIEHIDLVYKNSDIIHIYNWFNNPYKLRKWVWINSEFISMFTKWDNNWWTKLIEIDDNSKISNSLINTNTQNIAIVEKYKSIQHQLNINKSDPSFFVWDTIENVSETTWANIGEATWEDIEIDDHPDKLADNWKVTQWAVWNEIETDNTMESWDIVNISGSISDSWNVTWLNLSWNLLEESDDSNIANSWEVTVSWNEIVTENVMESWDVENIANNWEITQWEVWQVISEESIASYVSVDKYRWFKHSLNVWSLIKNVEAIEEVFASVDRYEWNKHFINLYKWMVLEHEFIVEDDIASTENDSSSIFEDLLTKDEIDIQTLESENEEFLQKVFEETRDVKVMNLIIETYLNEYQFIKAKRFIENLPEVYSEEINPSLYLRVAFNSFSLSSKTFGSNLNTLVEKYANNQSISAEEKIRYKWVLELMQQNYDSFSELSKWFTTESHKLFASKIQWYKDQTSKQMWMPWYYFDTLVALELFNQWLFQPAKVLALSSLQQNSKYILPYQVLAYANFLTNSWDTAIEYFKKLTDLDPNNSEKYRFLMWIAYYRNEKYEQSVLMLSMIKDEKLRLDAERYLIRDYLLLDQKNKLISSRWKLLWYDDLVASDFYTYFYEAFYRPYSEWSQYQIYAFDTDLAEKILRVCNLRLSWEDKVICNYWSIGKSIALWQFDWLESSLLSLAVSYPQSYLYHALWEYYINQWDFVKAKAYLIKAVSMAQKRWEVSQIKKLLQSTLQ